MYKLMLVDDEEAVREGVIHEVDWHSHGFEVVHVAENGKEAMDLIDRDPPDVVMTDIKMPFMDGLQLSEWIHEKFPTVKIIILTGFDEFEYAQKAVKLSISEYVLKPFSAGELVEALTKVKLKLDEEIAERENTQSLQEHYRRSLPVLREVFLASLLSSKQSMAEIEQKSAQFGLSLHGSGYGIALVSIDPEALAMSDRPELRLYAVCNIAGEIVAKHGSGLVFIHNGYVVLLAVAAEKGAAAVRNQTLRVAEEIRQSVQKFLKLSVTVGVGTVWSAISGVRDSYEDAVSALDYRLILGGNRVICIDDVEHRGAIKLRFDELQEHALIRCIKVGTAAELQALIEELFRELSDTHITLKDYQIYLLEIVTAILKIAKDAGIELEQIFGTRYAPFEELSRFSSMEGVKQWISVVCGKLMAGIATGRQSSYKSLVEKAKDFARQHYGDSELSITHVCEHLHISAGYFSGIFKKEMRMTFVAYLVQLRMEAAKELLRGTDMRAFEIAERVGYADANYFSFCFRKMVGVSPKEYRNQS